MTQQTLSIPYLVMPSENGEETPSLLVSTPDGTVLEFDISDATAINLDETLGNSGLWSAFFTSLIQSMESNQEHTPDVR